MHRQRKRRLQLEEEKRNLTCSPSSRGGISTNGSVARRRINYENSPSVCSGSSSMYTAEKGLTVGVGGVTVEGNRSHMLLGGDHRRERATQIAVSPQQSQVVTQPPRDLLDDMDDGGVNNYDHFIQQTSSQGEMSV